MEKKVRRPIVYVVLAGLLALAAYFFRDKLFQTDGKNPDVNEQPDLENPEIKLPERFKWEQFVTREPKLMLPVRPSAPDRGAKLRIDTECATVDGRLMPVIHLTYETSRERPDLRLDAAIVANGFVENRFTMVYPLKAQQRFLLAANSAFMADTSAIAVLGRAQFPVLQAYRVEQVALNPTANVFRHHFQVAELSNGLSYRFRLGEATETFWRATQDVAVTTPFCPNDQDRLER